MDIHRLQNEGNLFWSVISSSFGGEPNSFIKKNVKNLLRNDGALVYVCINNPNNCAKKDFMKKWDIDFPLEDGQVELVCVKDIEGQGIFYVDNILKLFDKKVRQLKNKGFENIMFYTTMHNFHKRKFSLQELIYLHKAVRNKVCEAGIIMAIRYIINDIYSEDFLKLIPLHHIFILEGPKKVEIYDDVEVFRAGFINLSRKKIMEEEHEKEIRKIEKLKTIGEFAEGLAHDFNNLLTTIVGYSQIGLLKDDHDKFREYFNIIYKTALDGKAIMSRMQDFVNGTKRVEKRFYNLNDLVIESLDMARHRIKIDNKNGQEIKVKQNLNSNRFIYCNEYEIRQVILNIILNALDSMAEGGVLTLNTYDLKENVILEVKDTGMGMEDRVREKVFEPYFTTKGREGTGLGLNIAKKILEDYSAKIDIESKMDEGTKFTICFPTLEEKSNFCDEEKYNALILENEYVKVYKLVELLNFLNIETDVKFLKENAWEKLTDKEYDFIIGCYDSKNLEAVICFAKLRERFPNRPFILAIDDKEKLPPSLKNIADGIIKKGSSMEELSKVIRKVLNRVAKEAKPSYNIN